MSPSGSSLRPTPWLMSVLLTDDKFLRPFSAGNGTRGSKDHCPAYSRSRVRKRQDNTARGRENLLVEFYKMQKTRVDGGENDVLVIFVDVGLKCFLLNYFISSMCSIFFVYIHPRRLKWCKPVLVIGSPFSDPRWTGTPIFIVRFVRTYLGNQQNGCGLQISF